jgi:hypothetical protein
VSLLGPPGMARAQESFDRLPIHLSDEQQREVLSGKTVVQLMPLGTERLTEVVAVALMDSAPERLFELLTDVEKFVEFMPHVKISRAERQSDGTIINHQELSLPFPITDRQYDVRITNGVKGVGAQRVWESAWTHVPGSGNISETRGAWVLTEGGPGRTLLLYHVFTDPGGLIPRWAYNLAVTQSLPDLLANVARRAREPK